MTRLTGDFVGVVVQLFILHGAVSMTGDATGSCAVCFPGNIYACAVCCVGGVAATADRMCVGAVAHRAREVQAVGVHVYIDKAVGRIQTGIKVAMFDSLVSATFKVAVAARRATGWANLLRNFCQIDRLAVHQSFLVIGHCGVMANQAVNIFF